MTRTRLAWRSALDRGLVIPACPLALTAARTLDERGQRRLLRYYFAAGAGGLAVGVHTTQFAIREPKHGLFRPILELAEEEMNRADRSRTEPIVRIAGICGQTEQALHEAEVIRSCGYHAGLLSLGAWKHATEPELLAHCRRVAEIVPIVGFYLQPSVGGRILPFSFWRQFLEIENVVAIKIAPFNRYQTLDVVRAAIATGRADVALYTGNDDNILADLLTPFVFPFQGERVERHIVGGLLGQWAVGTRAAVQLLADCHGQQSANRDTMPREWLRRNVELTDLNAAVFDATNQFVGCIAGIHEVLRRQGLLEGTWCLDPAETLGPNQANELDRVCGAYPQWLDEAFIREHITEWNS